MLTVELMAGKTILEGKVRPALRIQEVIVVIKSISGITTNIGDICITDITTDIADICIQGYITSATGICIPGLTIDIIDVCTPCVTIGITGIGSSKLILLSQRLKGQNRVKGGSNED